MPRNGRKPRDTSRLRTYPDTPVKKHARRKAPTRTTIDRHGDEVELPLNENAVAIWDAAKKLPHTVDWGAPEWTMLRHAVFLAHSVYSDPDAPVSKATEMRRVLSSLGYTADDRARLGIVYESPTVTDEKATPQAPPPKSFRRR